MALQKSPIAVVIILVILLIVIAQSFYTVDETERAFVLQLGKPVTDVVPPGLHFKLPLVQKVMSYDYRVLEYDSEPAEIITKDKKTMVIDNYARWRISEPLQFYRTARTKEGGKRRLDEIVYSELREALGRHTLIEIVATKRNQIMANVTKNAQKALKSYGISVVDVRIKRTDLPKENQQAIFDRMRSERQQKAKQYRSEGREEAEKIRASAEKEKTIMLAEAEKKADIMRGEGDAESTKIYAQAYSQGRDFYAFMRSLEAYRNSLDNGTSIILTPDSEFFKFFDR